MFCGAKHVKGSKIQLRHQGYIDSGAVLPPYINV